VLGVNPAEVSGVKLCGRLNTTLDRTMLQELSLHLGDTNYSVVFTDIVVLERNGCTVLEPLLSRWGCRADTVSTDFKVCAEFVLKIVSFIVHAAVVGDTLFVGILVDHHGVATIARAAGLAVDDHLSRKVKGSRKIKSV